MGDIPRAELDAIIRAADSWRGSQTERGFSMALGRIGMPGDEDCVLATATEDGAIRAVLQLVPWGADGLSLDLMRRDKAAQPGLNDFLIVETIKAASGLARHLDTARAAAAARHSWTVLRLLVSTGLASRATR